MADDNITAMPEPTMSHSVDSGTNEDDTTKIGIMQNSVNGDASTAMAKLTDMRLDDSIHNDRAHITRLADELIMLIAKNLINEDLKNLRLTSKVFASKIVLSFKRLLVADNNFDIGVMQEVAKRPELASQVVELVWHNVHFVDYAEEDDYEEAEYDLFEERLPAKVPGDTYIVKCPLKPGYRDFEVVYRESTAEETALYAQLADEKMELDHNQKHIETLRDALPHLTSLRRVTLTESVDQLNYIRYSTPTIRKLRAKDYALPIHPWSRTSNDSYHYGILTRALAASTCSIKEFIIDADEVTGNGVEVWYLTNAETAADMTNICSRGLERFDLVVDVSEPDNIEAGLEALSKICFKDILSAATSMQHFEFRTNWVRHQYTRPRERHRHALRAIPTKSSWPALKHLTIANMPIEVDDLYAVFEGLPATIEYLECNRLCNFEYHWDDLLPHLKARLPRTKHMLIFKIRLDGNEAPSHVGGRELVVTEMRMTMQHIGDYTFFSKWEYDLA